MYTVEDIFTTLRRPGLDPRGSFPHRFDSPSLFCGFEDVPGMVLEGTVSGRYSARSWIFGVYPGRPVHISQMSRG